MTRGDSNNPRHCRNFWADIEAGRQNIGTGPNRNSDPMFVTVKWKKDGRPQELLTVRCKPHTCGSLSVYVEFNQRGLPEGIDVPEDLHIFMKHEEAR